MHNRSTELKPATPLAECIGSNFHFGAATRDFSSKGVVGTTTAFMNIRTHPPHYTTVNLPEGSNILQFHPLNRILYKLRCQKRKQEKNIQYSEYSTLATKLPGCHATPTVRFHAIRAIFNPKIHTLPVSACTAL